MRVRTHFLLLVKESHQRLDEMPSECATCHLWLDCSQVLVCADVFELVDCENMKLYLISDAVDKCCLGLPEALMKSFLGGCLRLFGAFVTQKREKKYP